MRRNVREPRGENLRSFVSCSLRTGIEERVAREGDTEWEICGGDNARERAGGTGSGCMTQG